MVAWVPNLKYKSSSYFLNILSNDYGYFNLTSNPDQGKLLKLLLKNIWIITTMIKLKY